MAQDLACSKRYNVIHLIYRNKPYEQHYKDFQFGLATMRDHWSSGLEDIRRTLAEPERLAMPENASGFVTHDIHREEIEQLMERSEEHTSELKSLMRNSYAVFCLQKKK